ncbi:HD family phosphohydrolase [Desulfuromonas versatilis]|uniref:HD family phosphohydrolase n=1 Tax=Desulfuromonas versatilis TaxID=2802975 RepID=A0ABM8HVY1_9BACT|nr:HDOD domain-containing protein [Desulfuromonas versatilis]BCR06113.1 HD family phosphohydrolase [Desulfuromonas versatilis]
MQSELQSVVNAVSDLPPMPVVAAKVVKITQDPDSSAEDLARAISLDPAVSARVMKIANSSFYSMQKQVNTLRRAIVVLGERTLKSLVFASSMKGLNRSFGLMEKMLWEDAIGGAIAARLLALRFRAADPEEAFLGGLFRHIGKLVMNNMDGVKFLQMIQEAYNGEGSLEELERRYFPYSHAVIGEAVLRKWHIAESLVYAVRHHSDMAMVPGEDPAVYRLMATVNIADNFCLRLGLGRRAPDKSIDLGAIPGVRALGLEYEQVNQALLEFRELFEKDRETFMG